jgi:hypothetical protein
VIEHPEERESTEPTGGAAPGGEIASTAPETGTMIPARGRRSAPETVFMRLIATAGIVGIGVAAAAIMGSQHVHAWIIGLAASLWSVASAALLWSSRRL